MVFVEPVEPAGLLTPNKLVTIPQIIVNGKSKIVIISLAYVTIDDELPPDDDGPADEDAAADDDDDDDDEEVDGNSWLNFFAALLPAECIFF